MRIYDLITKKKHKQALTDAEIEYMIHGYVAGTIPDYQMSAMLMAIWFSGMDDHETTELTKVMARSGDQIDLSAIAGKKVDKHSTGQDDADRRAHRRGVRRQSREDVGARPRAHGRHGRQARVHPGLPHGAFARRIF